MGKLVKLLYYVSFAWVGILLLAEILALFTHAEVFTSFLSYWFFSWLTATAIIFIFVRFLVLMVMDLKEAVKRHK